MNSRCCDHGVLEWERPCHRTHHRLGLEAKLWCSLEAKQACTIDKDASQQAFEPCMIPKSPAAKEYQSSHTCTATPKSESWGLQDGMLIYHSNTETKYIQHMSADVQCPCARAYKQKKERLWLETILCSVCQLFCACRAILDTIRNYKHRSKQAGLLYGNHQVSLYVRCMVVGALTASAWGQKPALGLHCARGAGRKQNADTQKGVCVPVQDHHGNLRLSNFVSCKGNTLS